MKITSQNFIDVLKKTSLTLEERRAVVELLKSMSPNQIKGLYKILLEDSKETQKILKRQEMQNQKAILKLKQDVKEGKEKDNK